MTVQAIRKQTPPLQFDLDHSAQVLETISAVTVDPYKGALFYFIPFLKAFSSSHVEMRENDPAQEAMMPSPTKSLILREIHELKLAAGIARPVAAYTALNYAFSNAGGSLSLTKPALFIPHQHLFRVGKSPFTQETAQDNLSPDLWNYTDDETRFFIARELGHIKKNDALLRVAMKTAQIAALVILCATTLGWIIGGVVMGASIALHLVSERLFQSKMDTSAVEIAAKRLGDRPRALRAGLSALEKLQKQNLARREHSFLCRIYISDRGNNFLDFNHPPLTARIDRLRKSALAV